MDSNKTLTFIFIYVSIYTLYFFFFKTENDFTNRPSQANPHTNLPNTYKTVSKVHHSVIHIFNVSIFSPISVINIIIIIL